MFSGRLLRGCLVSSAVILVGAAACSTKDPAKDPEQEEGEGGTDGSTGAAAGAGAGADAQAGSGAATGTDGGSGQGGDAAGGSGQGGEAPGAGGGGNPGDFAPIDEPGRAVSGPIVMQVTTPQSPAIPGQSMLWTITVGNTGSVAVKAVNVLFRVPKGLSFTYTLANPPAASCGNSICSENEEATWNLGDLPAGASTTIQIDPSVLSDVGDGDEIAAQVRLNATDLDPIVLTKTVPVTASVPAEVTLAASSDPVIEDQLIELVLDVGHIGDAALFDGKLLLELPGSLEAVEASDGGEIDETSAPASVRWTTASLPVGATLRRSIKAKVRVGAAAGDILNPRASFSYEGATLENVAQVPISVLPKASPLTLSVRPAADPVVPGSSALYLVTVSNTSLRAVDGIVLWQRVPPELSFTYTVGAQPNAENCGNSVCSEQELSRWTLGTLAAGTSETVTVNAEVLAATAGDGTLVSSAFELRATGTTPAHAFKTLAVHPKPGAQLSLGTAVSPVVPGQTFSYDVDVGQIGLGSLQGSALKLELPAGVEVGAISDGGSAAEGIVSWDLGAIAVGAGAHRNVAITLPADAAPGSVWEARASLTYEGGVELDAVSENAVTVVTEALPLTVTVAATPNPIVLGDPVSYTTTIKNESERTIDGVALLLRLPEGLAFNYITAADPDAAGCGNSICGGGEEASWVLGSIAAGATKIVNVNPVPAVSLVGGSLVTFRQRLTAVDLGGTITVQSTSPSTK